MRAIAPHLGDYNFSERDLSDDAQLLEKSTLHQALVTIQGDVQRAQLPSA